MNEQEKLKQTVPSVGGWRQRASRMVKAVSGAAVVRGWIKSGLEKSQSLRAYYEKREPSRQTIIDLFGDSWKSALPDGKSGAELMFDDPRLSWLAEQIPGGLQGKSVLELGPFEGYQTYQLDRMGAGEIVAVEGNSINFFKCLCVKEMYNLTAKLAFGDIQSYLDNCRRSFDVVCASGVLYHSQEPVRFIEQATRIAEHFYLWTHYYSPNVRELENGQEKHFLPAKNRCASVAAREITLYARSYLTSSYHSNLPLYWEGGQEDLAYWLMKEDLLWLIERSGFEVVAHDGGGGSVNGLPCISLYARRKTKFSS